MHLILNLILTKPNNIQPKYKIFYNFIVLNKIINLQSLQKTILQYYCERSEEMNAIEHFEDIYGWKNL